MCVRILTVKLDMPHPCLSVVAIVQLPPPVNGLSTVNAAMTRRLAERGILAAVIQIGPPPGRSPWQQMTVRLFRTFTALLKLVYYRIRHAKTLYMPPDAASGLALNLVLLIAARILGYRIWFHHHNFSYLNKHSSMYEKLLKWSPAGSGHILLCERMGEAMLRLYPGALTANPPVMLVVPNAFLIDPPATPPKRNDVLTIGHLSNLTAEKGVLDFIKVFDRLQEEGVDVRAVLAGPTADTQLMALIDSVSRKRPGSFHWLGPVYGSQKDEFYAGIDVFVFPSNYVNEAQPLVLLEALASGAAVLAINRGCVSCDHHSSPGAVFSSQDFVPSAVAWLKDLAGEADKRDLQSSRALAAFTHARAQADIALEIALDALARI